MPETATTDADGRPMLVAVPSISRHPRRAIPLIVALHGPLDFLTAYWMMSVRGSGVEWNSITAAAFEAGPLAYVAFMLVGTAVFGGLLWRWRESLWSERWMPVVAEVLIIVGVFGLVGGNTLAALGVSL